MLFPDDVAGRRSQEFSFKPINPDADAKLMSPFSEEDFVMIKDLPGVTDIKHGYLDAVKSAYVDIKIQDESYSLNSALSDQTNHKMLVGRNLQKIDNENMSRYTVIDEKTAQDLFYGVDNALHQSLTLNGQEYTVIGVYENSRQDFKDSFINGQDQTHLDIPRATFDMYNQQKNENLYITVYYDNKVDMKQLSDKIKDHLNDEGSLNGQGSYSYFDMSEAMNKVSEVLNMITYFVSAVAAISLFIAGVGVMNMMYISVSERTKEIGIRRSLGATQASIRWQFLLEGIVITTIGGIIGYVLGISVANLIGDFIPFKPLVDISTAIVCVLISILIGIIFSVFPANSAAKKNVVEILR
ncbi:ABC transporter permease [Facklamia sp. DSM 111018]|uniref:ABC transporter permease n=1 Tax=Facklamia lactis TaxID=2749967 RepID=A0ABS0LQB1_9LACT|nr:ABC transporter permease [Facklamia lactis]MBG9986347.1 ABC transporter permease [Facklamia lactis]